VGQSARSAINNSQESFGSHRAIYFTTLFQLVEQVQLLLKGTSIPPHRPSSLAPGAGLAGDFAREMTALLPGMGGSGIAWAGNSVETCFGDDTLSAQRLSMQQGTRAGTAEPQLARPPAKNFLQA